MLQAAGPVLYRIQNNMLIKAEKYTSFFLKNARLGKITSEYIQFPFYFFSFFGYILLPEREECVLMVKAYWNDGYHSGFFLIVHIKKNRRFLRWLSKNRRFWWP